MMMRTMLFSIIKNCAVAFMMAAACFQSVGVCQAQDGGDTAGNREKAALYKKFTDNYQSDETGRKIAYYAALTYLRKYERDDDVYVKFLKHWIAKYEELKSPPTGTPNADSSPESIVKEIGDNTWKVTLQPGDEWFDTGIPVICNIQLWMKDLKRDNRHKWLVKLNDTVYYSQVVTIVNNRSEKEADFVKALFNPFLKPDSPKDSFNLPDEPYFSIYIREDNRYGSKNKLLADYDYRDTIKLKVDDEGKRETLLLTVQMEHIGYLDSLHSRKGHRELHLPAERWFQEKKRELARK